MRPSRSNVRRIVLIAALTALGAGRGAFAQSGAAGEGALEFILPTGARAVGMGETIAAAVRGSEAVWWNPALIARSGREASLFVRNKANAAEPETDAGGAFVIPFPRVGAVALSVRYLNYGAQDVTTGPSDPIGTFVNTSLVLGATFATTFGDRFAAGFTAKYLKINFDCTGGGCDQPGVPTGDQPSVSALDFGGQYFVTRDSTISVGAGVRNLGPKLQILDSPQADPLPARGDIGVLYSPKLPSLADVRVNAGADMITRLSGGTGPGFRVGAEVSYRDRYQARAGYMYKGPGEVNTPTLGFGVSTGKLQIDLAQIMSDLGGQTSRPTFLSLRYAF